MSKFSYSPIRGPLSGASFEKQTTAFFDILDSEINERFAELNLTIRNMQNQIATLSAALSQKANDNPGFQDEISSLERRVVQLENNQILTDSIPAGSV